MLLDLPALRTFVAAADLGGFGRAAHRLHRTPGAVSQQLKTLEDRLGQQLFARTGKRTELSVAGQTLLAHARRILAANDEAVMALRGHAAVGEVRFGMVQDAADSWLTETLGAYARACPTVRVVLRVGGSDELRAAVAAGDLDMAVVFGVEDDTTIARLATGWWGGAASVDRAHDAVVPLLLLDAPCIFRDRAVAALAQANRRWRPVLSSSGVSALWAAAAAGLGITARVAMHVPVNVVAATHEWDLPPLPPVALNLCRAPGRDTAPVAHLIDVVQTTVALHGTLPATTGCEPAPAASAGGSRHGSVVGAS